MYENLYRFVCCLFTQTYLVRHTPKELQRSPERRRLRSSRSNNHRTLLSCLDRRAAMAADHGKERSCKPAALVAVESRPENRFVLLSTCIQCAEILSCESYPPVKSPSSCISSESPSDCFSSLTRLMYLDSMILVAL